MVIVTLVLFLANTALSHRLVTHRVGTARAAGDRPARLLRFDRSDGCWASCSPSLSRCSLFFVLYRYASIRKVRWRTALLASTFMARAFEVAKRLYGLYLAHFASVGGAAAATPTRRGGALHRLAVLHGARLPARRRRGRDLGAPRHAAASSEVIAGTRRSFRSPALPPGIILRCLRSEGCRRVNRVRTLPVAALSDVRCRFGEPGALFL